MTKKFKIEVFKSGKTGEDDEHVVRVTISKEDQEIGVFSLAGGSLKTATGIAQDLKSLAKTGFDLTQLVPDDAVLETQ